jgi:hypothetical protein
VIHFVNEAKRAFDPGCFNFLPPACRKSVLILQPPPPPFNNLRGARGSFLDGALREENPVGRIYITTLSCTKRRVTKTLSAFSWEQLDGRVIFILHKSQSANSIASTHPHEQYHFLPQCDHIRRPMRRPHSFNSQHRPSAPHPPSNFLGGKRVFRAIIGRITNYVGR